MPAVTGLWVCNLQSWCLCYCKPLLWMDSDYHTETPHITDYSKYPGETLISFPFKKLLLILWVVLIRNFLCLTFKGLEEQLRFLRIYLESSGNCLLLVTHCWIFFPHFVTSFRYYLHDHTELESEVVPLVYGGQLAFPCMNNIAVGNL